MEETDGNPRISRIYCNTCRGVTKHELKYTHHGQAGDPSEDQFFEEWTDCLWACCGCETATLVNRWEMVGVEGISGAPQPEVHCYPPRTHGKRDPKHFVKLPKSLRKLYSEVMESFNSGHPICFARSGFGLCSRVCAKTRGYRATA